MALVADSMLRDVRLVVLNPPGDPPASLPEPLLTDRTSVEVQSVNPPVRAGVSHSPADPAGHPAAALTQAAVPLQ